MLLSFEELTVADRVLIVDHDAVMRSKTCEGLADNGLTVIETGSLREAKAVLAGARFDLVAVEHHMPGEDGMEFVRDVTTRFDVPLIIVSDRARLINRVIGLEMGADDFVAKPFEMDELVARVRAVLRRSRRRPVDQSTPATGRPLQSAIYHFNGCEFDLGRRLLTRHDGAVIDLTSNEIDLLAAFVTNPQRPLSRVEILEHMGKDGDPTAARTIDVLISKLRRKIEPLGGQPGLVTTVRGAGYSFTTEVRSGGTNRLPDAR
jgi:two-component system, OmpR family, response regulator